MILQKQKLANISETRNNKYFEHLNKTRVTSQSVKHNILYRLTDMKWNTVTM